MTVQQTQPYPHHRSFWFGDRVALEGQRAIASHERNGEQLFFPDVLPGADAEADIDAD